MTSGVNIRRERVVLWGSTVLLAGALAWHFACTLLYLTPPNPVRLAFHGPLVGYMHPYFYQSWRLFAPEPGGTDAIVLVMCRLREGQSTRESEWFDVTNARGSNDPLPVPRQLRAVPFSLRAERRLSIRAGRQ
jgi:hypothetical protein